MRIFSAPDPLLKISTNASWFPLTRPSSSSRLGNFYILWCVLLLCWSICCIPDDCVYIMASRSMIINFLLNSCSIYSVRDNIAQVLRWLKRLLIFQESHNSAINYLKNNNLIIINYPSNYKMNIVPYLGIPITLAHLTTNYWSIVILAMRKFESIIIDNWFCQSLVLSYLDNRHPLCHSMAHY